MTAAYRRPSDVAMVVEADGADGGADTVYLSHLPSGSLMVLQGTSALIYTEALSDADNPQGHDIATRLADTVGVPPDDIRGDVVTFLAELMGRGLLEATSPRTR